MRLTVLGCSSAIPTVNRHPSAHLLNVNERFFLIDAGEGTQVQLRRYGIKFQRIHHIFISHLHGDHYFGLIGLITSMHLLGREKKLVVFSPPGLKEIILLQFKHSDTWLSFPLEFVEITEEGALLEDETIAVSCFPLKHRIACYGFLFREKPKPRILNFQAAASFGISHTKFPQIKSGADVELPDGSIVPNSKVTIDPPKPLSFAYCSDTIYDERIIPKIKDVGLVYHEATFADEHTERAKKTYHTTGTQAAQIGKMANVGTLLLGHHSTRYADPSVILREAATVFERVVLAVEGETYRVPDSNIS